LAHLPQIKAAFEPIDSAKEAPVLKVRTDQPVAENLRRIISHQNLVTCKQVGTSRTAHETASIKKFTGGCSRKEAGEVAQAIKSCEQIDENTCDKDS
jgi:hypothetical protein